MSEHGPYAYSFVKERIAPRNPAGATVVRYRGRCRCGWVTNLFYSTPALALGAVRMTHNGRDG